MVKLQGFLLKLILLLVQSLSHVNSACYSATYHRVVTDTKESHHFNVSRNRRRTSKLSVRVHTSHSVSHKMGCALALSL